MMRLLSALAAAAVLTTAAPALADPPPVEDYGKLPALDMVTLSPDGDRYAFVAEVQGVRRLYVLTTDNKPLLLAPIGKVKVRKIEWAGDDIILTLFSATEGVALQHGSVTGNEELGAAAIFNLKTSHVFNVFQNAQYVQPAVYGMFGVANIQNHWYGYFGAETLEPIGLTGDVDYANNYFSGGDKYINTDLYRVDLESGALKLAAKGDNNSQSWLVGPAGDIVARTLYSETLGTWRVMSGASGGVQLDAGQHMFGGADIEGLGRTPNTILISKPSNNEPTSEVVALAGGSPTQTPDFSPQDTAIRDPQTHLWIGTVRDGDQPTPTLFDPTLQAKLRGAIKAFPGYNVRLVSWGADFNRMIMFTDGGDDSGTYWIVDTAKGSANILGGAYPTVTPPNVAAVQVVDWTASDGLALHGVLTLPPGRSAKKLPLIVMPHGGPEARDYPRFDWWAQAFASRGYAVFQPNFRGSAGYGQAFRDAGFGEWGRKMQTDISDGVADLARKGVIDAQRTCIVGWSYGGYAALAGVTVQQGLYRCAVSMAGVADPWLMMFDTSGWASDTRYWRAYLGQTSVSDQPAGISPVKLAAKADAPILLIHGDNDTVVPIDQTRKMESALRAAGKSVERLTLPGADHWLLEEDSRVAMAKASVAFVEKYNPPDPAPATAMAAPAASTVH